MKRAVVWTIDIDWIRKVGRRTVDTGPTSIANAGAVKASSSPSTAVICKHVPDVLPAEGCVKIESIC